MPFSHSQQVTLAVLPKLSGWTSMVFSFLIVYTVLRDSRRRSKAYHRLLCGISITDFSASFWLALSTWPIPRDSGVLWAAGTTTTCNLQGFFTQAGIASSWYNCSLALYFLLVIKYGWKESQIRTIEPFLHGIPLAWALISAVTGLALGVFGNANLWCWVKSTNEVFRWVAFYGPLWTMIAMISVICLVVLCHVRRIEAATDRRRRRTMLEYSSLSIALPPPSSSALQSSFKAGESEDSELTSTKFGTVRKIQEDVEEEGENGVVEDERDDENNQYVTEAVYEDIVLSRTSHLQEGASTVTSNTIAAGTTLASTNSSNVTDSAKRGRMGLLRRSAHSERANQRTARILAQDQQRLKRTRQVARQSFLYAGAFYLNWTALSLTRLLQTVNHQVYFPLLVIAAITVPIQGLPNFLVYLAPSGTGGVGGGRRRGGRGNHNNVNQSSWSRFANWWREMMCQWRCPRLLASSHQDQRPSEETTDTNSTK